MSMKENQQKNINNTRQFVQGARMQAGPGMQQPPMLPYHQRPSFPQPTMQQGPPHQLQQLPLNPPAVAFNIVPPSHPPTGNAVFAPYNSVPPSQPYSIGHSRYQQQWVYYQQPSVAPAGQGLSYTNTVSHPVQPSVPINRVGMQPQMQSHHVNTPYGTAPQQPPPPKQERTRQKVVIRDPKQGGKDVTAEILNKKKGPAAGESAQQVSSQDTAIRAEFIAFAAAAKESSKDSPAKIEPQDSSKKNLDKQVAQLVSKENDDKAAVNDGKNGGVAPAEVKIQQSNEDKSVQEPSIPQETGKAVTVEVSPQVDVASKETGNGKIAANQNTIDCNISVDAPVVQDSEKAEMENDNEIDISSAQLSNGTDGSAAPSTVNDAQVPDVSPTVEVVETKEVNQKSVSPSPELDKETSQADSLATDELKETTKDIEAKEKQDSDESTIQKVASSQEDDAAVNAASLANGVEKPSAAQVPKRKKKGKYKDKDTDLMSAFTDKPEEEINDASPEEVDEPEVTQEDIVKEETWEDKDIKGEEEAQKSDTRIRYDRDFLLELWTKERPKGLPDIEPVLPEAHEPTKPLEKGRLQSVGGGMDFMPTFMQKGSSGRQIGTSRSGKGSRTAAPKRIIPTSFEAKVELKKSDNAWVRTSEVSADLSEYEKEKQELFRTARGILNKLTPQKFEKLVDTMKSLQINTEDKLKGVIDLIFQKALLEPSFSKAYAQLCEVLSRERMQIESVSNMTFKRSILNRCQTEFEKEKTDEQQLEKEQSKHYENAEEEKAWQEELALRRHLTKKRSLGNIRFIGELFKLQMLTEAIMHMCVTKLLKDSDEESLECLCQLLTTIGKDLDHEKAKPRTEQYFNQIERIINQKKVSSRIAFMLKDVIDLRAAKWVSRRITDAPKTITEIHEEVKQEEIQMQLAHQQAAQKRMMNKGGGRDSPSLNRNEDGWNQVSSKNNRSLQPVDPSRLKITKRMDSENISLGPGGRPGAWAQGASGGGSSRFALPGEGESRQGNRFSALSGGDAGVHRQDGKGRSIQRNPQQLRFGRPGSLQRTGGRAQQQHQMSSEKAAAVESVRRLLSNEGNRPTSPSSAAAELAEESEVAEETEVAEDAEGAERSSDAEVSDEKIRNEMKMTVEEFLATRDQQEAEICIRNLNCSSKHDILVLEIIFIAIEKKPEDVARVGLLLHNLVKTGLISLESFKQGLVKTVELAEDVSVDIPHIWTNVGGILGPLVEGESLPLSDVKTLVEPLVQCNKAGLVMAETLAAAAKISSEMDIKILWHRAGLEWQKLLREDSNLEEFISKNKMEFTTHTVSKEDVLRTIVQDSHCSSESAINLIEKHIPRGQQRSAPFVRELVTAIFYSDVSDGPAGSQFEFSNVKKFKDLLKYVNSDKQMELETLYAAQLLAEKLKHPIDFLRLLFEALYDLEIISEGSVNAWETSREELLGKGSALNSVKGFLEWLKSLDDECQDGDKL